MSVGYEQSASLGTAPIPFPAITPHNPPLSGREVSTDPSVAQSLQTMTEPPRMSVRPDVARAVRAVSWFEATKYSPGSIASQWAIHDSRLGCKGTEIDDVDAFIAEASAVQIMEAICRAELRRKLYAPPEQRTDVRYEDGESKGQPMRAVAPRRVLARTVRVKPTRTCNFGVRGVQGRRIEIAACLGKLTKAAEVKICQAARDASERSEVWNELQQARSVAQRLRGGAKKSRRAHLAIVDAAVSDLMRREKSLSEKITAAVASDEYRAGIVRLAILFSVPEVELVIFGESF